MALTDPQSITIGSAIALGRTQDDGGTSIYRSADLTVLETVSAQQTKAGRIRSQIRVDQSKVSADPLTAVNIQQTGSVYIVFDFPKFGFSTAEKIQIFTGLNGQLTATSNKVLTQLLGLEH